MLIVSAILVAGVSIAGCTQDSESSSNGDSSSSPAQILSPSSGNTEMKDNDQPAFNWSGEQNRTPSPGMMNGTPSFGKRGTPPSDSMPSGMNGTPPSGLPPAGMGNRTLPTGPPPSGS
jgi:hypothetical protein